MEDFLTIFFFFYLHRELSPAVASGEETTPLPVTLVKSSRGLEVALYSSVERRLKRRTVIALDVGTEKSKTVSDKHKKYKGGR